MSKLIIVEGVDSTGKSTLARKLAVELNACYHHASGHKSLHPAMFEHHKNILDCAEINLANGHNVVLDRHWPSELCYGSILRPHMAHLYDFNKMIDRLRALNHGGNVVRYIYCSPEGGGWDRYQQTHADHDQTVFRRLSKEDYYAIHCEYKSLFGKWPGIKYSIEEGPTLEKIVEMLQ